MRRKTLERLQPQWEELAEDTLPAAYPNTEACVVRGPCFPTLMPTRLRFVRMDDSSGARPASRELEAAFADWYNRTVLLDEQNSSATVAGHMARDLEPGTTLVAGVAAGSYERRYSHFTGWKPDCTWFRSSDWGTRIELPFDSGGMSAYRSHLGDLGEWVSVVSDAHAAYQSVLVACPETDIQSGRWWHYADGSRGTPMPILELGSLDEVDELYWTTGASESHLPILRELDTTRSHAFAASRGPAGFVQFVNVATVTRNSEFLDLLDQNRLEREETILASQDWDDLAAVVKRHRTLVPAMRRFYDRAYQQGFCIVHFGFVDELPSLPAKVSFPRGERSS